MYSHSTCLRTSPGLSQKRAKTWNKNISFTCFSLTCLKCRLKFSLVWSADQWQSGRNSFLSFCPHDRTESSDDCSDEKFTDNRENGWIYGRRSTGQLHSLSSHKNRDNLKPPISWQTIYWIRAKMWNEMRWKIGTTATRTTTTVPIFYDRYGA